MPFDEVLLLYYLVYFYGKSIPRNSHQSLMEQNEHQYQRVVTKVQWNKRFHSRSPINSKILAEAYNCLLTRLQLLIVQ